MVSEGEIRYGNGWHASPHSEPQLLIIDGSYTPSADGATFGVVNSMRGERIYDRAYAKSRGSTSMGRIVFPRATSVSVTRSSAQVNTAATVGILRESVGLVTHIEGDIMPS
ncbi:hypothetical protein DL769_001879 [Monosporascus sp. CRB-8-3]|nr:hypothetical protein DL769_001879 [Monosporascus sp. CRB-8-3]